MNQRLNLWMLIVCSFTFGTSLLTFEGARANGVTCQHMFIPVEPARFEFVQNAREGKTFAPHALQVAEEIVRASRMAATVKIDGISPAHIQRWFAFLPNAALEKTGDSIISAPLVVSEFHRLLSSGAFPNLNDKTKASWRRSAQSAVQYQLLPDLNFDFKSAFLKATGRSADVRKKYFEFLSQVQVYIETSVSPPLLSDRQRLEDILQIGNSSHRLETAKAAIRFHQKQMTGEAPLVIYKPLFEVFQDYDFHRVDADGLSLAVLLHAQNRSRAGDIEASSPQVSETYAAVLAELQRFGYPIWAAEETLILLCRTLDL